MADPKRTWQFAIGYWLFGEAAGGDTAEEEVEVIADNVGVDEDFALAIHEADVHLTGMEVDSAVELSGGRKVFHRCTLIGP
jgi:hypothetical protein